jgi:roadblock/LC7 domain-containing protein
MIPTTSSSRSKSVLLSLFFAVSGVLAAAPAEDSAKVLEYRNTVYVHPASIMAMAIVPATSNSFVGLQLDYERSLQPHVSAMATVSYLGTSITYRDYDVNAHIFDVMLGMRWYPFSTFQGMYLQPMLDYNWSAGDATDSEKHGRLEKSRLGPMVYVGTNRRFGPFTVDWNLGIGFMYWDDSYKDTKLSTGETDDVAITKKLDQPWASIVMGTPQFGGNLMLGWAF